MDIYEVIGWVGSALMVATFAMKRMIPLRIVGIAANAFMIVYAGGLQIYPVLALQVCLLPVNVFRLWQVKGIMDSLTDQVEEPIHTLAPYLKKTSLAANSVLFRAGDVADELYVVEEGRIRLEGLDKVLGPGEIVGEIGVLGSAQKRTATAVAEVDTEISFISGDRVRELYVESPTFALAILRVVLGRVQQPRGSS